jgi:hypothetical protein
VFFVAIGLSVDLDLLPMPVALVLAAVTALTKVPPARTPPAATGWRVPDGCGPAPP